MSSERLPAWVWKSDAIPAPQTRDSLLMVADFLQKLKYDQAYKALVAEAKASGVTIEKRSFKAAEFTPLTELFVTSYKSGTKQGYSWEPAAKADVSNSSSSDESSSDESEEEVKEQDSKGGLKRKRPTSDTEEDSDSSSSSDSDSDSDSGSDSSDSSNDDAPPAKKVKAAAAPVVVASIVKKSQAKSAPVKDDSSASSSSDSESESDSGSDSSSDSSESDSESSAPPPKKTKKVASTAETNGKKDKKSKQPAIAPEVNGKKDGKSKKSKSTQEPNEKTESDTKVTEPVVETNGIHPDRLARMPQSHLTPSTPNGPVTNGVSTSGKKSNIPFSRISPGQAIDPRFASNKYVPYDYAQKAHNDLIVTKGKGFTKEKNKKKRGSYRGGAIDLAPKGIKFED